MKKLIFILVSIAVFTNCEKIGNKCFHETAYIRILKRSLVEGYFEPTSIEVHYTYYTGENFVFNLDRPMYVRLNGNSTDTWTMFDEGEKKVVYDALCEKNGDMEYNRIGSFMYGYPYKKPYIQYYASKDPVAINIVSQFDFDAEHPAGTSLNEFFTIECRSLKPYIDSGYDKNAISGVIKKDLKDITAEDLVLTSRNDYSRTELGDPPTTIGAYRLTLKRAPASLESQVFVIELEYADGTKLWASEDAKFQ